MIALTCGFAHAASTKDDVFANGALRALRGHCGDMIRIPQLHCVDAVIP
jgi:hypothetical protein